MPRKIRPTDAFIQRCTNEMQERNELVIPPDKMREIVESEPTLVRASKDYPDNAGRGLDTYDREYLYLAVAKSIGWNDWPVLSSDDGESREFMKCLCDAGYVPGLTREMIEIYDRGEAPAQKRARGELV